MKKSNDYPELQLYCKEIKRYSLLTHEQEFQLTKRYQQGDEEARKKIIESSLRFVVNISRKYFYSGHNCLEIIQEGNLGLIRALERFDPERGVPFVYYAVWWIKATINEFLKKSGKGSLCHAKDLFPLDKNIGPDDGYRWIDLLTNGDNPEKHYDDKERSFHISSLLEHCLTFLSKREAHVINQRFFADPPKKLNELGEELGVSRERVRQIQNRSMQKLKLAMENKACIFLRSEALDTHTPEMNGYASC